MHRASVWIPVLLLSSSIAAVLRSVRDGVYTTQQAARGLSTCADHLWMIANGDAPDYIRNHPAMKGIDLSNTGKPSRSPLLVTKSLLFGADGNDLFATSAGAGGKIFRAIDKKTGKIIHEMTLPAMATGIPMTYLVDGWQFIVVAVGAMGIPPELVALALP